MSAQTLEGMNGLVAINSLMAMVGGTLAALMLDRNDPGFIYNGPLAGLVAVCAGSDLVHPLGAVATGAIGGAIFVLMFIQNQWKIDDVLASGPCTDSAAPRGGIAAGIFGMQALGGRGGVSLVAQFPGTVLGVTIALMSGFLIYGALKRVAGIRLDPEQEFDGADLSLHRISATPKRERNW